jgi:hypothetical protein
MGAIWCCLELGGAATGVLPVCTSAASAATLAEPTPTVPDAPVSMTEAVVEAKAKVEVEADVVVEAAVDVEAAVEAEVEAKVDAEREAEVEVEAEIEEGADELTFEVVDELVFEDTIEESPEPACTSAPEPPPADEDAFATLVRVVEEVAMASGAGADAMTMLRVLLGKTRLEAGATDAAAKEKRAQAVAWQAILRGESEDFGACGAAALDEWCAALLAHVLGAAARADGLRRELRQRGVAAFGIVADAA